MPRRITKKLIAARSNFQNRVSNFIRAIGGVEHDGLYRFKLDTPIGEMGISVWDLAIMCRFWNVVKASEFTRRHTSQSCNPHSGKWNWHFSDDATTLNANCEAEWVRYMTKLMSLGHLPEDLTQMTTEQTQQVVEQLSRLPLRELRRRQDLTQQQSALAFELRNDDVLRNLQVRAEHLRMAVDRKCFAPERN